MDLPHPGIQQGPPALQVNSLATELSGKPDIKIRMWSNMNLINMASFEFHRGNTDNHESPENSVIESILLYSE